MKVGGLTEYTGQIYALIDGSSITLFDGMYVQAFVNKSSRSEHCWLFAFASAGCLESFTAVSVRRIEMICADEGDP
jgi:hypothetical protein